MTTTSYSGERPSVNGPTSGASTEAVVSPPILEVEDLTVSFGRGRSAHGSTALRAIEGVNLRIDTGDICAVVGESGCGKSTLAYALLGVLPRAGRVEEGSIRFRGRDLVKMPVRELDRLRGRELAIVFQAAMNSFNPVLTISRQVDHILEAHPDVFDRREEGRSHFHDLLEMVRLPADRVLTSFESQLSGGMKQRVSIAVALLLKPGLLVLDEPTTALDVLNQRLVIDILRDLNETLGVTIVFATHDLAVAAELATRAAVMYAGTIVERGGIDDIFYGEDRHPYVVGLIKAIPRVRGDEPDAAAIPGHVPDLSDLPSGCRFEPRCGLAGLRCRQKEPELLVVSDRHEVACHVVSEKVKDKGVVLP